MTPLTGIWAYHSGDAENPVPVIPIEYVLEMQIHISAKIAGSSWKSFQKSAPEDKL